MKTRAAHQQNRRMYEKPELRTINLMAEEVLGGGCKKAGLGDGPGYTGTGCITPSPCNAIAAS